jgi:pimeloyl-ACP methyl ester carboxylesterase
VRRIAPLVLLVAGLFAAPAEAATFVPCAQPSGFYCGTVEVPLDRSGGVAGTIALQVVRRAPIGALPTGAIFALAGGPGQAAIPFAESFAEALTPALGTRELIVFDQRGTGRSGYLSCPRAERKARSKKAFVQSCAAELGRLRDFYTTRDSVDDLEAVRQAIGQDKVVIYGVSYGTYVAQLYARRYPEHVEALVLDSVVPPTGVDAFERTSFRAIPRVLSSICASDRCDGISESPVGDLAALLRKSHGGAVKLQAVDLVGRPRSLRAGQPDLFQFFKYGMSFDGIGRARLPGALRSARAGDLYPLGRLIQPFGGYALLRPAWDDDQSLSVALNLATTCSEIVWPWLRSDPVSVRESKLERALRAIPASAFAPFARATGKNASAIGSCRWWPPTSVDPTVTGSPPNVPLLVLEGVDDALTPWANGLAAASGFPQASVVALPDTGHSVISTLPSAESCLEQSLTSFFNRQLVAPCADVDPYFMPLARDPTSIGAVPEVGVPGLRGRTIGSALLTLNDIVYTVLSIEYPVGLRGGTLSGSVSDLRLDDVVYVPGVVLNGRVDLINGIADLVLSGKGAHGRLEIVAGVSVEGALDGMKISLSAYPLRTKSEGRLAAAARLAGMRVTGVPRKLPPGADELAARLRFTTGFLPVPALTELAGADRVG